MSRVGIREADPARDAPALFALMASSRPTLAQWLSSTVRPQSAAEMAALLLTQARSNQEGRAAHRLIEVGGEVAGVCSLHGINLAHGYARLGYWLADHHVGKGTMGLALRLLLAYAFDELGLHRLELGCAPENVRSCKVAERLGFRLEGELRDAQFLNGRFWNMRCYGLLADEWKNQA